MSDVTETQLPGVGVRHEFTTDSGERLGVVSHRGGRRELLVYDREDPDVCSAIHLSSDDTRTLANLLGALQIHESLAAVQQAVAGLVIEWIEIPPGSAADGHTIGEGQYRTRTGASIIAVIRGKTPIPAPAPDFRFESGDVAVAVGTTEGLDAMHALLGA